ncbi:hypothetical protein CLOBAR_00330 [Intestinibacter bartlettii DSM 16795]|nr:hypothetical protein CLOBAR_00330 [Intestinibacter bartlettii DSM 16795]
MSYKLKKKFNPQKNKKWKNLQKSIAKILTMGVQYKYQINIYKNI